MLQFKITYACGEQLGDLVEKGGQHMGDTLVEHDGLSKAGLLGILQATDRSGNEGLF